MVQVHFSCDFCCYCCCIVHQHALIVLIGFKIQVESFFLLKEMYILTIFKIEILHNVSICLI
jgi:hypothetical protein